ncbi:MAG TPA: shikimate dehydrogenase [Acidimicrobiia bacterium]|nr:shikimate dehydrogenase [Acidimicrobiia bacterium]
MTISGATRVAGVIGDPVTHSLSPVLHNAAYRELGIDWVYVAFAVPAGATKAALDAIRVLGLAGLSITMPHKTAAAAACDRLTADAGVLNSVNTVSRGRDGDLLGDSTDGEGFLRALRESGTDPAGAAVLLLGAGGAARAVALALARAHARVTVCARRPDAAAAAAELGGGDAADWSQRAARSGAATIIVNATPIGMGDGNIPLPPGALHSGQVVVDLVYAPLATPLLRAAAERGARAVDGLGMLVHQAALQVERWTGHDAPIAAMRAAAAATLGRPGS